LQDGKVLSGQGGILSGGGEGRGSSPPLFPTLERATPKKP
jgi:hypothetical protein